MAMHTIEIEDTIWQHLKKFAEPLEDTPNSVLLRLLFPSEEKIQKNQIDKLFDQDDGDEETQDDFIDVQGVPKALSQILEVLYEMRVHGFSRIAATNVVAKRRGTTPQTVIDKYCRQLNKKAHEIDLLFKEPDLSEFKSCLKNKFTLFHEIIEMYFETLNGWDEGKKPVKSGKLFTGNPSYRILDLERV